MSSALQQKLEFCFMRRNTQGSLFILLKKAEKILGSALRACKGGRDLKAILLTYFSPTEQCLICLTYITYKTTENKHVRKQACPNSLMWPWAACTRLWIFSWRYLLKDCRTVLLRWSVSSFSIWGKLYNMWRFFWVYHCMCVMMPKLKFTT